jgi:hypothetical protein
MLSTSNTITETKPSYIFKDVTSTFDISSTWKSDSLSLSYSQKESQTEFIAVQDVSIQSHTVNSIHVLLY